MDKQPVTAQPAQPIYTTKVITAVNGDKWQYFHQHAPLGMGAVAVVDNGSCLRIEELSGKIVTYPLCNVERFETERRK